MALRTIVQDGDPILKKVCRPVTKFDDRLGTLLDDMKETLLAANGLGLAGPQVGMINLGLSTAAEAGAIKSDMPFPECGAMSQGYIGYDLQNALKEELLNRGLQQGVATVLTQVVVDGNDPAFQHPTKPIGSFLFLGPTGVGKTELSKALAEALFGDENAMVRIDMSEYMEKHSVSRMVGSPPGYVGYEEGGQLSEKVRRNPYSVVLFDEIEKASPEVFNILLQVLDDGHITDGQGRKVDFKNTVIIMTSNAGARSIAAPKRLGFTSVETPEQSYEMMKKGVMDEIKTIFKPEFLNRIDDIIVFHPLEKEEITRIVRLLTDVMAKRVKENMNITVSFTKKAIEKIAEEGYDKAYGARPLRRAIQSKIEDAFAEEYLLGNIKAGDKVSVGLKTNGFSFRVVK